MSPFRIFDSKNLLELTRSYKNPVNSDRDLIPNFFVVFLVSPKPQIEILYIINTYNYPSPSSHLSLGNPST